MSENAAAACRAEELALTAATRLEAAGRHEARTLGEALREGGMPGHFTPAILQPEPRP
jgi:hypothetical protein